MNSHIQLNSLIVIPFKVNLLIAIQTILSPTVQPFVSAIRLQIKLIFVLGHIIWSAKSTNKQISMMMQLCAMLPEQTIKRYNETLADSKHSLLPTVLFKYTYCSRTTKYNHKNYFSICTTWTNNRILTLKHCQILFNYMQCR